MKNGRQDRIAETLTIMPAYEEFEGKKVENVF